MVTRKELDAMIMKVKQERKSPIKEVKVKRTSKDIRQMDLLTVADVQELSKQEPIKRESRKDYGPNGHWSFDKQMCNPKRFGFIYVIRDLRNGKSYIGKKQYHGTGIVNNGDATNWPWYISSRDTLVAQIKVHGKENFEFIVLEEYGSDRALGYAETWSLMFAETPSNQDKWYNRLVNKISWFSPEKISDKHKQRLAAIINNEMLPAVVL